VPSNSTRRLACRLTIRTSPSWCRCRPATPGTACVAVAVSSEDFHAVATEMLGKIREKKAAYLATVDAEARLLESMAGADLPPGVAVPSTPRITVQEGSTAMTMEYEDGHEVTLGWPLVTAEWAWAVPRSPSPPAALSPRDNTRQEQDSAWRPIPNTAAEGSAKKVRGSETRAEEPASSWTSMPPLLEELPPLPRSIEELAPALPPPGRPPAGPRSTCCAGHSRDLATEGAARRGRKRRQLRRGSCAAAGGGPGPADAAAAPFPASGACRGHVRAAGDVCRRRRCQAPAAIAACIRGHACSDRDAGRGIIIRQGAGVRRPSRLRRATGCRRSPGPDLLRLARGRC